MNPAEGITPQLRDVVAANDSSLLMALITVVVVNLLLAPVFLRTLRVFFKQLFRTHREAAPGEKTLGERLVVACAVVQLFVFEGLLLFCATGADQVPPLASLAGLTLLALLLFGVQYVGYALTGYAFAAPEQTRLWLSAYLIIQACTGFLLIIPAMGALFYPDYAVWLYCLSALLYVATRMPLYISEFKIFYTSPTSLFYFFLYLCTLEIVPIAGVLAFANFFSTMFC